jgi:uncharacterized protein (DUF2132 family)
MTWYLAQYQKSRMWRQRAFTLAPRLQYHYWFERGLYFGYPICCILDFIADLQHERAPAVLRGVTRTLNGEGHVPCRFHKKAGAHAEA